MSGPWIVAFLALWVVVSLSAILLLGVLRRIANVLEQAEAHLSSNPNAELAGASPGTVISAFELRDVKGRIVRSDELLGKPAIFLFMSAACRPCLTLVEELRDDAPDTNGVALYTIFADSAGDRMLPSPARATALYQADRAASKVFQNGATPQAFAVDAAGVVIDSVVPRSTRELWRLAEALQGGDAIRGT
jgi:cytochrome oxidase Cu insertion factor (SCO1/SenC/PrrC family)